MLSDVSFKHIIFIYLLVPVLFGSLSLLALDLETTDRYTSEALYFSEAALLANSDSL